MNKLKSDLFQDALLDAVHVKKHKQRLVVAAGVTVPVLCAFGFLFFPDQDVTKPVELTKIIEKPIEKVVPRLMTIESEDELLELLAQAEPIVVTKADGSRWLYLAGE